MLVNELVSEFTTESHGKNIVFTLKEIFCDYLITVIEYYEKNNLPFDKYNRLFFKKELSVSLHDLPKNSKYYVAEVLHLTCEYYFKRNLEKVLLSIQKDEAKIETLSNVLCLPTGQHDYLLSKGLPSYFIFTSLALTLSVNVNLKDKSIKTLTIVKDRLHIGVNNVN